MQETGTPDPQMVIYAIQRGAYDKNLSQLALQIQQRRDRMESVGLIQPSIGDILELFDDLPQEELRRAKLQVVGFLPDKRIRGRLMDTYSKRYPMGKILRISAEVVYRVHYYA